MRQGRLRRRPMADINIVPYVDVMLVLLVIFMVCAPVLTQGVQVDLPGANAEPLPQDQTLPLVVTVDSKGLLFVDQSKTPIEGVALEGYVQELLKQKPNRAILVKGDRHVDYGRVIQAMVLLKKAGAIKVGLMTQLDQESS